MGEPSPTLEELDIGDAKELPSMLRRLTGYTRPINYYGLPAISLPAGFSKMGFPLGIQLVGRPFAEQLLFQMGAQFQELTDHHFQSPNYL